MRRILMTYDIKIVFLRNNETIYSSGYTLTSKEKLTKKKIRKIFTGLIMQYSINMPGLTTSTKCCFIINNQHFRMAIRKIYSRNAFRELSLLIQRDSRREKFFDVRNIYDIRKIQKISENEKGE